MFICNFFKRNKLLKMENELLKKEIELLKLSDRIFNDIFK